MRVTLHYSINLHTGVVTDHFWYYYDGPVALACGASGEEKQAYATQSKITDQLIQQAQQVFGNSSQVFNNLVAAFSPVVAAGPNQEGFSAPQMAAINSSIISNNAVAARNAMSAVKSAQAAVGGGNEYLPSGAQIGAAADVAGKVATNQANELTQANITSKEIGRENFFKAAGGLESAPQVFNPATSAGQAEVGSSEAQSRTAADISAQNNSWVGAVTGALGGIAGSAIGGWSKNWGAKNG